MLAKSNQMIMDFVGSMGSYANVIEFFGAVGGEGVTCPFTRPSDLSKWQGPHQNVREVGPLPALAQHPTN